MQRLKTLGISIIFAALTTAQTAEPISKVNVGKFGYHFIVPKSWNVFFSNPGIPFIFNYPLEQGLPQGLVPENGAMIFCSPELSVLMPGIDKAIKERIAKSADTDHTIVSITHVSPAHSGSRFPRNVVRVESDVRDDEQADTLVRREVSYRFVLKDQGFKLQLTYWKGDPRSAYFESVTKRILDSISL